MDEGGQANNPVPPSFLSTCLYFNIALSMREPP